MPQPSSNQVVHDSSLSGSGTTQSPLSVVGLLAGTGSPVGVVGAPVGTIYRDLASGNLWEKSGSTDNDWNRLVRFEADGSLLLLSSVLATAGQNNQFAGQLIAGTTVPNAPGFLQGGGWSFQGAGAYPALPAGETNDYVPPVGQLDKANLLKLPTDPAGSTLTGIQFLLYQRLTLLNLGPGLLTLPHDHPRSIQANRYYIPEHQPIVLPIGGTVTIWGQTDLGPGWIILR